jgi:hypothetical protein
MSPLLKYHVFVTYPDETERLWISHFDFNETVSTVVFKIKADLEKGGAKRPYETIAVTVEDDEGNVHEVLRYGNSSPVPILDNRPMPEFAL